MSEHPRHRATAAAHPASTNSRPAPTTASISAQVIELCLRLFPVVDPRHTVSQLVSGWRSVTQASDARGALLDRQSRTLWIASAGQNSATTLPLDPETATVESLRDTLTAESPCNDAVRIPLFVHDTVVGCVLLDSPAAEPDTSLVEQLTLLTVAVLGQLGDTEVSTRFERAKLEAMAEFAAGAGHEINNPVATISGRTQLLLREETDPQRRQSLLTIGGQARRIRDMIGDAMVFARPPEPQIEQVHVDVAVQEVLRGLLPGDGELADRIRCSIPAELQIAADPVQFRVVLQALLENALQADPDGQPIEVHAEVVNAVAEIRVIDHGQGFSERDREHAFDPFYSGREAGRGLGFGLAKCWRIVSNHGGRIEIHSQPSEPTTLTVFWPLAS